MTFSLIQPDRFSEELEGIVLKKNSLILSEEFLEIHGLEKAFYAWTGVDLKNKIIAIKFSEELNSSYYKINYPQNLTYGVLRINKIISLFKISTNTDNRQVNFQYKKEHDGMQNVFLLDLSPFCGEEK